MAKIVCEYDSDTGDGRVTIDGKELANISSFSMCQAGGYSYDNDDRDFYCSIYQTVKDIATGLKTYMSTTASTSEEGKKGIAQGGKEDLLIPGYVTFPAKSPVHDEISKYFARK
jgi:hypothetical protein